MPGHKRRADLGDAVIAHDLPLSRAPTTCASPPTCWARRSASRRLWGADRCRFSVAGSTHGNQALALAVGRPGDRVIVARTLHKSLFAGLVLAGLEPVWVRPDVDPATGLALGVPLERVRAALAEAPDARAVFLVEPGYTGVLRTSRPSPRWCTRPGCRSSSTRPGAGTSAATPTCRRTPSRWAPTRW